MTRVQQHILLYCTYLRLQALTLEFMSSPLKRRKYFLTRVQTMAVKELFLLRKSRLDNRLDVLFGKLEMV